MQNHREFASYCADRTLLAVLGASFAQAQAAATQVRVFAERADDVVSRDDEQSSQETIAQHQSGEGLGVSPIGFAVALHELVHATRVDDMHVVALLAQKMADPQGLGSCLEDDLLRRQLAKLTSEPVASRRELPTSDDPALIVEDAEVRDAIADVEADGQGHG